MATRLCKNCKELFDITKSNSKNIYCAKRCSATFNNRSRTHSKETRDRISASLKDKKRENGPVFERIHLKSLVDAGFTTSEVCNLTGKTRATVRYWLEQYNLEPYLERNGEFCCSKCGEDDPINFYGKMRRICKDCFNSRVCDRSIENKLAAVEYMGGCCIRCGYKTYYGALEFHHRDPNVKDFTFNNLRLRRWRSIIKELDKCDCLCANCHREVHHELRQTH